MQLEARLRAFSALARVGSFSGAADELHVSQPAVSKHIVLLERELGTPLVLRRPRVALTPAGRFLADYLFRIEALLAQAGRSIHAAAGGETGVLSVAASGNPGNYLLPSLLTTFHRRFPAIEINFEIGNSAEVEEAVRQHRVEIGVVGGASAVEELESEPLLEDRILLVGAPELAGRALGRAELEALTWIYREEGSATRGIAEEARRQLGVRIRRHLDLPSWEAIKRAAATGGAVAACSEFAVNQEIEAGTLVVLEVPRWKVRRLISIVSAAGVPLTPPAERFAQLLRETWQENPERKMS